MPKPLEPCYTFDSAAGTWRRPFAAQPFEYSDGDAFEEGLYQRLAAIADRSVLSDALRPLQTDWAYTYHLSPKRASLLRPLEKTLLRNARVLELGCGCGGITRYLAETAGNVVAVEGSYRRAGITALRCEGMRNVTIIVDTIQDLPADILGTFDVVTLIGVLEYARVYGGGVGAEFALLRKARSFLRPGGVLILAIENKLGLKYFAGVPEDHLGTPWTGVMDAYADDGVVTFSRKELEDLLVEAGFARLEQFVPIPDYKLPLSILHPAGLYAKAEEFRRAPLFMRSRPHEATPDFNVEHTWSSIDKAGLIPDMADSLCFTAISSDGESTASTWPESVLVSHYGEVYAKKYAKEVRIVREGNMLRAARRHLAPGIPSSDTPYAHQELHDEPYLYGELLYEKLRGVLLRPGWRVEHVAAVLQPWITWLESQKIPGTDKIPGAAIDAAPFNVIHNDDGTLQSFDQEWIIATDIPLAHVVVRSVFLSLHMINMVAPPADKKNLSVWTLLMEIFRIVTPSLSPESIAATFSEIGLFDEYIVGVSSSVENVQKLHLIEIQNIEKNRETLQKYEKLREQLSQTKNQLTHTVAQLAHMEDLLSRVYASRSWRLTKPLRELTTYIRRSPRLQPTARVCKKTVSAILRKGRNLLSLTQYGTTHIFDPIPGLLAKKNTARKKALQIIGDFPGVPVDIAGQYVCLYGAGTSFENTTTAIVAHWDPDGKIDPYVIHMCKHFKSLGHKVVLSSDGAISYDGEPSSWADAIIYRTCPGYDFTSWKAALACFPSLLHCEELILCNDSVFGPIGSYAPVHAAMQGVECDFWGITASSEIIPHIQSFYLVFREKLLNTPELKALFDAVPLSASREQAIYFELRLALYFALHGFIPAAFAFAADRIPNSPIHFYWRQLLDLGLPFIKKNLLTEEASLPPPHGWVGKLAMRGYPVGLIFNYFWRVETDITASVCAGRRTGNWPPDVFVWRKKVELPATPVAGLAREKAPGVFLHAYYPDRLEKLGDYIRNIPREAHLYVSTDTPEKAARIDQILYSYAFAHCEIRVLPNKGWDIAPFLLGFQDVINTHDVILKIHAKESPHITKYDADLWRETLFSSLIGSEERIGKILSFFHTNRNFGMIAPPSFLGNFCEELNQGLNHSLMAQCLAKHGVTLEYTTAIDFPMGSMFWCQPQVLRPWLDLNLSFDDFGAIDPDHRDGSLAHALERLFFLGCGMQNMYWGRVFPIKSGSSG